MNHETAIEVIMTAWKAAWDAAGLTLPVEVHNQPFKRPTTGAWARLTYLGGQTSAASLGTVQKRTPFALALNVFLPENTGTRIAYRAADAMGRLDGTVARSNDGKLVVHFREAGIAPGNPEEGIEAFVVTIPGIHDIYG